MEFLLLGIGKTYINIKDLKYEYALIIKNFFAPNAI